MSWVLDGDVDVHHSEQTYMTGTLKGDRVAIAKDAEPVPAGKVRVTCEDDQGEPESQLIENDYVLVCAGNRYLDGVVAHANGTVVLTIKVRP